MGLFGNLTNDGLEQKEDRLGGGFKARDTDVYEMEIKMAFAGKSTRGANYIDLTVVDDDGKEYSEQLYFTNAAGQNFFMAKDKDGKETGKKRALPGFDHVNDIFMVAADTTLAEAEFEEKTVQVYDFDAGQKLPKKVMVAMQLIGKKVYLAIQKKLENKSQKDSNNVYQPIADTRDVNSIEKVGHYPTKLTVLEAEQGKTEGEFLLAWQEKNKGVTIDKRTIKDGDGGQQGRPGASRAGAPPAQNSSGAASKPSLFAKK